MLKHIVFWKLRNAERKDADAAAVKQALEALRGRIDGLRAIEVGRDIALDKDADDIALYCEFDDREALERYQNDPQHTAARAVVGPLVSGRRVVDFES